MSDVVGYIIAIVVFLVVAKIIFSFLQGASGGAGKVVGTGVAKVGGSLLSIVVKLAIIGGVIYGIIMVLKELN